MFAWEHSGRRSVAADDPQNGPLDCPAWADGTPAGYLPALWGYWLAHMMRCIQSTWERSNV
jgi:hypothetical protein